jgi:hypothetical protein
MAKEHEELIVITKTYDLILWSCKHTAKFPRNHRFVWGECIERSLYGILEGLLTAKYSRDRAPVLAQVNLSPEILRFQLRLAKDLECLGGNSYGFAARAVDEIGRLVGGWIRRADQGQPLSANRGQPLSAGRPAPAIVELPLHGGRCRVSENTLNPIQNETCDKQTGRFKQRVAPAALPPAAAQPPPPPGPHQPHQRNPHPTNPTAANPTPPRPAFHRCFPAPASGTAPRKNSAETSRPIVAGIPRKGQEPLERLALGFECRLPSSSITPPLRREPRHLSRHGPLSSAP